MQQPDDMPRHGRRALLAAAPLALLGSWLGTGKAAAMTPPSPAAAAAAGEGIVIVNGWILSPRDLERMARHAA